VKALGGISLGFKFIINYVTTKKLEIILRSFFLRGSLVKSKTLEILILVDRKKIKLAKSNFFSKARSK